MYVPVHLSKYVCCQKFLYIKTGLISLHQTSDNPTAQDIYQTVRAPKLKHLVDHSTDPITRDAKEMASEKIR